MKVYSSFKISGCIGHNTSRCPLSAYKSQRLIEERLHDLENHGMTVLQTQEDVPLYTNQIRVLIDRFIHRNPIVNLMLFRHHMAPPSQDSYLFPHLYLPSQVLSDSSSDEYYDASPDSYRGANVQILSGDFYQDRGNFSRNFNDGSNSVQRFLGQERRNTVSPTPGARYGLDLDSSGLLVHRPALQPESDTTLNLNLPPSPHDVNTAPPSQHFANQTTSGVHVSYQAAPD